MTTLVLRCAACKGVAHPATGCQYSETVIVCGPCVREFWRWVKGHTNIMKRVGPKPPKGSKEPRRQVSFYEAAGRVVGSEHGRVEPGSSSSGVEPR